MNDAVVVYGEFARALDRARKVAQNGTEYWRARDIQGALGYQTWENFRKVLERAVIACESSGREPADHIRETTKKTEFGMGAQRMVQDWFLSRFGCYLIAMNAESSKQEVAFAQTYFAVQARRQERRDQLEDEDKRIEARRRITEANKALAGAAKEAGVQRYPIFQAAGIKKLYGGLGVAQIKARKNIGSDGFLDRAGRAELAMNEFRITQTEEKLAREKITGEERAIQAHATVGATVRQTVRNLGGTMPEDLPPETSIKKLESQRKAALKSQKRMEIPKPD